MTFKVPDEFPDARPSTNFTRISAEQVHLPWAGLDAVGRYLNIDGAEYRITAYDPQCDQYRISRTST